MNMEDLDKRLENILNNQEKIKADIEELNRHVEELKREELEQTEKTPIGWIPEELERYWFVDSYGNINGDYRDKFAYHSKVIKHTRVFKTREEAEFEAERMKVIRELEKFACEFGFYKDNYFIYYDYRSNQLFVDDTVDKRHELHFESGEKAREAVTSVGEERVKKYYLGVTN